MAGRKTVSVKAHKRSKPKKVKRAKKVVVSGFSATKPTRKKRATKKRATKKKA